MKVRRVAEHLKHLHWTTIAIDLVIVVVGVFIGMQASNWNQQCPTQGFAKRMGMVEYWRRYGWPDLCKPTSAAGPDAFACR